MGLRFVVVGTLDAAVRAELEAFGGGSTVIGPVDAAAAARLLLGGSADSLVSSPQWRAHSAAHPFQQMLDAEFARAVRYRHPIALLSIEVDGLAELRASQGGPAAEAYLSRLDAALRRSLREMDVLARLEDDTFGVLLPETGGTGAAHVAERLRALAARVLAKPAEGGERRGIPLKATVSVGLSESPAEGVVTGRDLHARAVAARSRAREGGGDRVVD
ncbi:MAG TPA: diguanylate cyclase [Candidatus Polarisedimenticolaceae bacterium]